jgi:DNA-binding transcriptional ArsR family regulator
MAAVQTQAPPLRRSIVELDPGLAESLDLRDRALARRHALVDVRDLHDGPVAVGTLVRETDLGMIVLSGLAARETPFAGGHVLEIHGPEDLVLADHERRGVRWEILAAGRVALLDARFGQVAARLPSLSAALLQRAGATAHWLAARVAVLALPRVEDRVLAGLGLLADRWGRVGPDGLVVPGPLTHEAIGRLVGARRSTVTLAISALRREGRIDRRPDGRWVLCERRQASEAMTCLTLV